MNIYQKKKEHYSLIYLLDKLDNLFGYYGIGKDISIFNNIKIAQLTTICFQFSSDHPIQDTQLINLRNIKNRKVGQRLLIFINSSYSIKPDITGFYYKSQPNNINKMPTFWSAKQVNSRYDSLEFIVGLDNEFYLINNNNFNITERI